MNHFNNEITLIKTLAWSVVWEYHLSTLDQLLA